ncbi:MAG: amidohydrolase family protein [Sphingobium sp.]
MEVATLKFGKASAPVSPTRRNLQSPGAFTLPAGTVVVSVDSHHSLSRDIFYERFPTNLKDRAPRVWRADGVQHIGFNGKSLLPPSSVTAMSTFDSRPGSTDIEARVADLQAEGIDKELVFGNALNALFGFPDLEVRELVFRIYNEYLAEAQEKAPGIFYGVGLINFWDLSKTAASIEELKNLGLKTFLLPLKPGADTNGTQIEYHSEDMEPFWDIVEDAGLPIMHHIGENIAPSARNDVAIAALQNFSPFRRTFGEYIFGGILDRNPRLQVAWIEAGLNWALSAIQDATFFCASFNEVLSSQPKKEIIDYWRDHMFASFMYDPLGLKHIDEIGVDKALWASDYPHAESTLGYGWSAMQEVTNAVSPDDARKILGGNAMKLFNL